MTRARLILVTLGLVLVGLAGGAAAQTAAPAMSLDDAVRGLESAYGKMTDLKAEFDQTAFNKSLNQSSRRAASCAGSTPIPRPSRSSPTARRCGSTRRR